ncbi:MAG: BTAD domain-containing putative transcriptional regulator [Acidimicrobiales bacterium]
MLGQAARRDRAGLARARWLLLPVATTRGRARGRPLALAAASGRGAGDPERRPRVRSRCSREPAGLQSEAPTCERDALLARLTTVRLDAEDDEGALTMLQRAIELDPHAEELYRQAMAVEADLGRPDAARRTFRRLEARLAELDLEPQERTRALLNRIMRHAADPPLRASAGQAPAD